MLYQAGPADTLDFMLLGYGVIFGVMGLYVLNLILRTRNLRRDEDLLSEVAEED